MPDPAGPPALPRRAVATWPVGSFVENIAPLPGGDFRRVAARHERAASRHAIRTAPEGCMIGPPRRAARLVRFEVGVPGRPLDARGRS